MDEAAIDTILERLIRWGLVEDVEGDIRPTRRWNAKLQAAAEKLNLLVARTGTIPEGNPLVLAVSHALANENLETDDESFTQAVQILVMLELSRMAPHKRAQMGFSDVRMPGDPPEK